MPAAKHEIRAAEEEGIKIELLVAPVAVLTDGGKVAGLRCIKMELGNPTNPAEEDRSRLPDRNLTSNAT